MAHSLPGRGVRMRRLVVTGVIAAVALAVPGALLAAPAPIKAQSPAPGTISGVAKDALGESLPNVKVRIRNANTGEIVAELRSASDGSFSVTGLQPGNYVVEVLDSHDKLIGLVPSVAVSSGSTATVAITAAVAGAGGVSLFGLGTAATVGVLGAAAVGGFVAVKAVTNDASPSK